MLAAAGQRYRGDAGLAFSDDFATGNFSKWQTLQWTGRNSAASSYSGTGEYSGQITSDGTRPHVARFEVRDGDVPPFGGDERAEMRATSVCDIVPGDERWYTFEVKIDSAFATTDWGPVMMQMHGLPSDGTPGAEFYADPDGNVYINNGSTGVRNQISTVNAIKGAWHRVTLHIKFSSNSAVGFWEVYLDGVKVVSQVSRATMITGDTSAYLKMGIYRSATNTSTVIVSFDNVRVSSILPAVL